MNQPRTTDGASEKGFTLIELLVVIIILGILAAVVVFAVGGIGDRGQDDACRIDTRTIRTAEEAYYARNRTYAEEAQLVPNFMSQASTLHDITGVSSTGFTITVAGDGIGKCGPGGAVGTNGNK